MVSREPGDPLARLQADPRRTLAELFMTQRPRLRRMIDRRLDARLSQRVDASDILQEGFIDAAQRLNEYLANPQLPFALWLRFLVKQRMLSVHRRHFDAHMRDARREQSPPIDSEAGRLAFDFSAHVSSPSQQAMRGEMQSYIQRTIAGLSPLDREIVELRHFEDLTNDEVAIELGISKSASSKRYIRAIERLRDIIQSYSQP